MVIYNDYHFIIKELKKIEGKFERLGEKNRKIYYLLSTN